MYNIKNRPLVETPSRKRPLVESLDEEWETTAEVLNSNEDMSVFLQRWSGKYETTMIA